MKLRNRLESILKNASFRKILLVYIIFIIAFGTSFFLLSSIEGEGIYEENQKIPATLSGYLEAMYFSFVTSTSLGYGDIKPMGISRLLSVMEVLISLIIFGVLISKLLYEKQDKILEELYDVSLQERFTRIISGLYNSRAEIERIMDRIVRLKKGEIEELLQNIESNIHLLSSYLTDSEKMISEFRKNTKNMPDSKEDIILDNVHNSLSKLEELFLHLKRKGINCRRKIIIDNLKLILNSTENICRKCTGLDYANIHSIITEVEKHSVKLKTNV